MVRIKKPTKDEMSQDWNSKEPRELAYEIAHYMGGKWPERHVRQVPLTLEGAPLLAEELFEVTQLNPTLLNEMTVKTRLLFLEVYLDDIQDVYSEVMESLVANPKADAVDRVTYNTLRKFKHLSVSLGFKAVSDTCQEAFDHPHSELDEWPEVAPDDRPGCYCTLDVATFTRSDPLRRTETEPEPEPEPEPETETEIEPETEPKPSRPHEFTPRPLPARLTAASTALVKRIVDAEGELPPVTAQPSQSHQPSPAQPSPACQSGPAPPCSRLSTPLPMPSRGRRRSLASSEWPSSSTMRYARKNAPHPTPPHPPPPPSS